MPAVRLPPGLVYPTTNMKNTKASVNNPAGEVSLSVIIPALNEEHVIGRCIESLRQAELPDTDVEIIVVDNGSTDHTAEVARASAAGLNLRVLDKSRARIGSVRNFGAREAQGKYLAFLDADCLVPSHWLRSALELLVQNPMALIGAPYSIPPDSSWVARAWSGHQGVKLGDVSYIPGGDLLVAKSEFLELGGFDEKIQTNEDYEFCQRARGAGMGVRSFSELMVNHLGTPQTLREFYRKQRWHGKDVFRVFFRSLPRLRNLPSVAFACYTLGCLAGLAAGIPVALTSGDFLWPLIFTIALLSAPLALSLRSSLLRNMINDVLPLTVLFLAFGFARAACLVGLSSGRRSRLGA